MSDCLGKYMEGYRNLVSEKSNEVLLRNVKGLMDEGPGMWYDRSDPLNRAYMRLVKQEIYRRGLGS